MERNVLRLPRLPKWVKYAAVVGAIVGTCGGAAGALRYRLWKLPSSSMWPTLFVGERVFALRATGLPARGKIAFFKYPEHPEQSFAKRVVGMPGDVVETQGHDVLVNGWTIPRCVLGKTSYVDSPEIGSEVALHSGELDVEWLGDDTYLVFHEDHGLGDRSGPFTVKQGEYFVLGDNRSNSHDSRTWNGGQGGGVPFANTQGVLSVPLAKLPSHVDAQLAPALAACLAKRPASTTPPPAR